MFQRLEGTREKQKLLVSLQHLQVIGKRDKSSFKSTEEDHLIHLNKKARPSRGGVNIELSLE